MRYGGHQTFVIREGWLYKGIDLLLHNPELYSDEYLADHLGVGRNMAMAIKHWLLATRLADKADSKDKGKNIRLKPNDLTSLIWEQDKYFLREETWWIIHINLINNPDFAAAWNWFFTDYYKDRFEKPVALEALKRWETLRKGSNPSDSTFDRDLLVFLSTYARAVPPMHKDPEEEIECPLRDLGLMTHFKSSGYYQLHRTKRDIDTGILLYALNTAMPQEEKQGQSAFIDRKFTDIVKWPLSPTKLFVLSNEDFYELLLAAERTATKPAIQCRGLAGERQILFKRFGEPFAALKEFVYKKELEANYA